MEPNIHNTNCQNESTAWDSDLTFRNDIDSPEDPPFTFTRNQGQDDQQSFMYSHHIIEDDPPASKPSRRRDNFQNDPTTDEKLELPSRTGTGFSSRFSNLQNHLSFSSTRSPITHFMRDWWLELIACVFLLAALIAIIITAHEYQDRTLPNLPSGISINSILAIFNVILKAAMLLVLAQGLSHLKWTWFRSSRPLSDLAVYDNASRGPLGSIWLMCRLRGRDIISTVGALLTIAAVILDPMAQQVIRYYNCQRVQPSLNGTLPRTNAYMEIGAHATAGINSVPQALQAAINGGVFVPGVEVDYGCSSGNCTFPITSHTIGMQSVCADVSEELVFANISMGSYETLNATLPSGLYTSYNAVAANATLMTMEFNMTGGIFEIIVGPRVSDPQTPRNYCSSSTDQDSGWVCRGWGAARCQIQPVVYTVSNASVEAGKLKETLTYAATLNSTTAGFGTNSYTFADLSNLTSSQIAALRDVGYKIDSPPQQWLPYNISVDFQGQLSTSSASISNATRDIVPKEHIYQVYSVAINSLYNFLSDYFSGSIVPYGSRWTGSTVAQQIFNNYGATFESVDSIMRNVSGSMTTYIRQNGVSNNSAPARGEVWETETCIRVRWAYVAFPASLTGLTILFFITMVAITSRAQQGVHHDFKSSPLALLFHGLDENTTRRVEMARAGESNEVGELREEARGMWVRLSPTDKGWRFVADESQTPIR